MLFNALALAFQLGQSIFLSPEDRRPWHPWLYVLLASIPLGSTPAQPTLGWSPWRVLQWFLPIGICAFFCWGPGMLTHGERTAEYHT